MKKGLKIAGRILAAVLLILLALLILVQSPAVQTALVRKTVDALREQMDADITVGSVSVKPFDAVSLQDVTVVDTHPFSEEGYAPVDTLIRIGSVSARFSVKGLLKGKGVYVSRLTLKDGAFSLVTEPDPQTGKGRLSLMRVLGLGPSGQEKEKKEMGDILEAGKVEIENFTFRMVNYPALQRRAALGKPAPEGAIDWNDFEVNADIVAHGIKVAGGVITGTADHIATREKHGMNFTDISGKVRVGDDVVRIDGLHIQDSESDLYLDSFRMTGNVKVYNKFIEKVRLDADILPGSVISMKTIRPFARGLDKFTFKADLSGGFHGYVSDFTVEDITFHEIASGVSARVNGGMTGLPKIGTTLFDYKVKDLSFTLDGLSAFIREWAPGTRLDLRKFAPGERFRFNGTAKGPMNRLNVKGNITGIGEILADVTLRNVIDKDRALAIGGSLETREVDAGRIAGTDALGPVSLRTSLEATLPKGGIQVRIDSLDVSRLSALGYDYTGISAAGTYSDNAFDGRIIASDPNLNFIFQGLFNLSPSTRNAAYQFYANLGYADLNALHIDRRGRSKVSFQTAANFIRTEDRDLLGEVTVSGLQLENEAGRHDIGDVTVSAHANDNIHRIRLTSKFADGTYVGEKSILDMVSDLQALVVDRELPALNKDQAHAWSGTPYEMNFTVLDATDLLDFLCPGVYVEKNSDLKLKVSREGALDVSLQSGRLALGNKFLKDVRLSFNNAGESLQADLSSPVLSLGGVELKGNRATLFADDNHIGLGYTFDNETDLDNRGELFLSGDLDRTGRGLALTAQVLPSNLYYEGNGWGLTSGDIVLDGGDIRVDALQLTNDEQHVLVEGGFSPAKTDTLSVRMEKLDIALLNTLLMNGKLGLEGRATGRALVLSPSKPSIGLLAGIVCDSTRIAGERLGQLDIESLWNDRENRFDFSVRNRLDGLRNLDVTGNLKPSAKTVAAEARLNRLNLAYAQPLLSSVFSGFDGFLSGTVRADGKLDDIHLSSEGTELVDGRLQVDFTHVTYEAAGPVAVDDSGLHFTDVRISDGDVGTGRVSGGILFSGLKNFKLDTRVNFDRMKVLAIPAGAKAPVYGDIYGTGSVDIKGPFDDIVLSVDARTVRDGQLHIPIGSVASASKRNLLTFTEPEVYTEVDPYELMMATGTAAVRKKGDLDIRLKVHATPSVEAFIDIGEGNTLNGLGNGLIEIESRTSQNNFNINGYYTLSQGNFHFSAMGLVSRDFTIQNGSSIRFNGDVMNSDLDVNGLYTTKTSLANLISDTTAVNRRTVECGLHITDKLRNPEVQFTIEIPDLDPATQAQVESALNTDDKIQKQFLYLLITNGFLPDDDSGITTGSSNMLLSNVSSIMAGQLNNIFQKLDIPLDLGLNYQQTERGTDIFDVALSTQLFNNRVLVNGTIGNKQYGTSTSEVTGDLDIEIKLDKPGTFRLNLFSHSADQFTSYLDNSQRNGAGIAYQREFNTFRDLLRDLFSSRRKREERALEGALSPAPTVTLQIDSTGHATPLQ